MSTTTIQYLRQAVHTRQRSLELRPSYTPPGPKGLVPKIHDIRSKGEEVITPKEAIIEGLLAAKPRIPEFLLWDDKGLELFDKFSQTETYYPFHSEIEIFNRHAAEIVKDIPDGSLVLELGCGTIRKTQAILNALLASNKSIAYHALDLSLQTLQESITVLADYFHLPKTQHKNLTITGLLGTYEDSISYISTLSTTTSTSDITILWLGNSIANFSTPTSAGSFLSRLTQSCISSNMAPSFIISTDTCPSITRMNECYDLAKPELMTWLRHGFVAANEVLQKEVFKNEGEDWVVITEFEEETRNLETYYVAGRDVVVEFDVGVGGKEKRMFEKGSRIGVITSGKWSGEMMSGVCERAGLVKRECWRDEEELYSVYLLTPS